MKAAVLALALVLIAGVSANERDERLFALYSTTSVTRLTTTTVTGLSTCLSVASSGCTGRKRRSVNAEMNFDDLEVAPLTNLESSQDDALERQERDTSEADARALTFWTTVYTTLTLTSTSALASTTVTASALCAAPGVTAGCFI